MVVVTNLGNVSYLVKNSKYDFEKAVVLLNEAIDLNNKAKNIKDLQEAADYFLKSCYNVGIAASSPAISPHIPTHLPCL